MNAGNERPNGDHRKTEHRMAFRISTRERRRMRRPCQVVKSLNKLFGGSSFESMFGDKLRGVRYV